MNMMTFVIVATAALTLSADANPVAITPHFDKKAGALPLVNGLGRAYSAVMDRFGDTGREFASVCVPYMYLHNNAAYGYSSIDISNLFRDFGKDANDIGSYDFTFTDMLVDEMIRCKIEPVFRLGECEEEAYGVKRRRTFPPKDALKWAHVAEKVIAHYTENWGNGRLYSIEYFPIWHGADKPGCWGGTAEDFHDFYGIVAKHLKARFPERKIGGAGLRGDVRPFLKAVKARGAPLDYLTFEANGRHADVVARLADVKAALEENGFAGCELLPVVHPSGEVGSERNAAEILANYIVMAKAGVQVALTAEDGCAWAATPLFRCARDIWKDGKKDKHASRRKEFQALEMYDLIYRYRDAAAVGCEAKDMLALGGRDDFGTAAALVVNLGADAAQLDIQAPGYHVLGAYRFGDKGSCVYDRQVQCVAAGSAVLVTFEKDDRRKPRPLASSDACVVDFGKALGRVKPVHGAGQWPLVGWDWSLFRHMGEAKIPLCRSHDVGGGLGRDAFFDVSNIFRDFDADETRPENYDFTFTDLYVKKVAEQGGEIYWRLGETIEVRSLLKRYRTFVPRDAAKWARVCEHIIAHYNEGWADGFRYGHRYFEIINEPDGTEKPQYNGMWFGTFRQYLEFYDVVARHLKARFPHIKVGAYGCTGFGGSFNGQPSARHRYLLKCFYDFMRFCRERGTPVDFFSYHCYGQAKDLHETGWFVREELVRFGFASTEIHMTEWKSGWKSWNRNRLDEAARNAATLVAMNNGAIDLATIYDGRIDASDYCPFFDCETRKPTASLRAFAFFSALYADGIRVATRSDECRGVWLTAARDDKGGGHALIVNNSSGDRPLDLRVTGGNVVSCLTIDAKEETVSIPLPKVLAPFGILLVEFKTEMK